MIEKVLGKPVCTLSLALYVFVRLRGKGGGGGGGGGSIFILLLALQSIHWESNHNLASDFISTTNSSTHARIETVFYRRMG